MRLKPLIAVPLIAIALAGCTTQQPEQQSSATSAEEKPLFATEEEALAAAQAAYAHYLEVSDQIARDGGANPERLRGLVTDEMFLSEKTTLLSYANQRLVMRGQSAFDSSHIQEVSPNSVSMYLCLDTSGAELLNSGGLIVRTATNRWPLLVVMSSEPKGELVLAESQTWSGTNFC